MLVITSMLLLAQGVLWLCGHWTHLTHGPGTVPSDTVPDGYWYRYPRIPISCWLTLDELLHVLRTQVILLMT